MSIGKTLRDKRNPHTRGDRHAAHAAGRIALDTEFMGEGRYRTLLCLIQLAVADDEGDEHIQIVDPLAGVHWQASRLRAFSKIRRPRSSCTLVVRT